MSIRIDFSKGVALSLEPANKQQEAIQSIYIVLNTPVGTVPYYREFGIDNSYMHKPIVTAQAMYAAAITEAVERFVPNVSVEQVLFENNADEPSTLYPILEVTINE